MLNSNARRAMAAGSAGSSLTAVGWQSSYSVTGYGMDVSGLEIVGATSPQSLSITISLPSINDSVDIYLISTTTDSWSGFGAFHAASGQVVANPEYLSMSIDYTGSETLPRTIGITITHVETSTVLGSFNLIFNPEPV